MRQRCSAILALTISLHVTAGTFSAQPARWQRRFETGALACSVHVPAPVAALGDHSFSAAAAARGQTMESKITASTHSAHMVVSPPTMSFSFAGVMSFGTYCNGSLA